MTNFFRKRREELAPNDEHIVSLSEVVFMPDKESRLTYDAVVKELEQLFASTKKVAQITGNPENQALLGEKVKLLGKALDTAKAPTSGDVKPLGEALDTSNDVAKKTKGPEADKEPGEDVTPTTRGGLF